MVVCDEEFDVTTARFEIVMDGVRLVFGYVITYVQFGAFGGGECGSEFRGEHFICAVLSGHYFSGVVVA